jgi:hypothetical protein
MSILYKVFITESFLKMWANSLDPIYKITSK